MIISYDPMKLQKDIINQGVSETLINNILSLVRTSFPGITHIASSVPINTDTEFQSFGNSGSPETLNKLWIDAIHSHDYNVLLRGTDILFEGLYNAPLTKMTGKQWIDRGIAYLDRIKSSLKDGDIIGLYPEFDSTLFGKQFQSIDDGDNNANADANNFLINFSQAILDWSTANNIKVLPYITVNRSEMINGYVWESVWQKMGAIVYDFYGFNQTLGEMPPLIDEAYNKYKIPLFQQEWGDTRSANVVASDPTFTAEMAQIFFDKIKEGEMIGINFWNLFDTPQEGILSINGNEVSLNEKGKALSQTFQKNFGTTPLPPTPPPPPLPVPPVPAPTPVSSPLQITITLGNTTYSLTGTASLELTSR